jgi:hypothetical protein
VAARRSSGLRAARPLDLAGELRARRDPDLAEDPAHVALDRLRGQVQRGPDLFVRLPFGDELGDLALAAGQRLDPGRRSSLAAASACLTAPSADGARG